MEAITATTVVWALSIPTEWTDTPVLGVVVKLDQDWNCAVVAKPNATVYMSRTDNRSGFRDNG